MTNKVLKMGSFKVTAHRGFSAEYPENTMVAMEAALKLDVDMIEMDVHMTSDGQIILMHDHTVDRTTNGTGLIREKTLAEMRELDAGSWKGERFAGEKVPTFREFLELMKDHPEMEVIVELKDYPHESGDFAYESCDKSLAMLAEYGMEDRIYINSWSGDILSYVAQKYPGRYRLHGYYPMFLNKGEFDRENFYSKLFCVCLFNRELAEDGSIIRIPEPLMGKEHFEAVAKAGVEAWVCFEPDEERYLRAAEYGAVTVTANDSRAASDLLDRVGLRKHKV